MDKAYIIDNIAVSPTSSKALMSWTEEGAMGRGLSRAASERDRGCRPAEPEASSERDGGCVGPPPPRARETEGGGGGSERDRGR